MQGVRVLDLTRLLPGPWATLILADLGADVVRVEDPRDQDLTRAVPPAHPSPGGEPVSSLYLALNRGKRSIALDLKAQAGREAFLRLVERADVVVEGFRPGVMDRLGLGWDVLSARNPRLVMASLSGFGQTGPHATFSGHDLGYMALAGGLGIGGPPEGPPAHPGVQVADLSGSLCTAAGVLAGLLGRERQGKGCHLDLSLYDSAVGMMVLHLATLLGGGEIGRGKVRLTGSQPNYRVYRTREGRWASLSALEPKFWKRFVTAVGRPELEDKAFSSLHDPEERARLHRTLEELFASKSLAEWEVLLGPADCCFEPVLEGKEIVEHPQARARGIAGELELPGVGRVPVPRTPIRPWGAEAPLRPAPRAGEHGSEVLQEAGFTTDEIDRLRKTAILG